MSILSIIVIYQVVKKPIYFTFRQVQYITVHLHIFFLFDLLSVVRQIIKREKDCCCPWSANVIIFLSVPPFLVVDFDPAPLIRPPR